MEVLGRRASSQVLSLGLKLPSLWVGDVAFMFGFFLSGIFRSMRRLISLSFLFSSRVWVSISSRFCWEITRYLLMYSSRWISLFLNLMMCSKFWAYFVKLRMTWLIWGSILLEVIEISLETFVEDLLIL